jgi:hypothetical protein
MNWKEWGRKRLWPNLPEGTEKNQEEYQLRQPVFLPIFYLFSSRKYIRIFAV